MRNKCRKRPKTKRDGLSQKKKDERSAKSVRVKLKIASEVAEKVSEEDGRNKC